VPTKGQEPIELSRPSQLACVRDPVEIIECSQQHGSRSGKGGVLVVTCLHLVFPQTLDPCTVALHELKAHIR
jgi:hypothetical protein